MNALLTNISNWWEFFRLFCKKSTHHRPTLNSSSTSIFKKIMMPTRKRSLVKQATSSIRKRRILLSSHSRNSFPELYRRSCQDFLMRLLNSCMRKLAQVLIDWDSRAHRSKVSACFSRMETPMYLMDHHTRCRTATLILSHIFSDSNLMNCERLRLLAISKRQAPYLWTNTHWPDSRTKSWMPQVGKFKTKRS